MLHTLANPVLMFLILEKNYMTVTRMPSAVLDPVKVAVTAQSQPTWSAGLEIKIHFYHLVCRIHFCMTLA